MDDLSGLVGDKIYIFHGTLDYIVTPGRDPSTKVQGFPKRRPFLKIENNPNLLNDDKKGKLLKISIKKF